MKKMEKTSIQVSKNNKDRLEALCNKNETYDSVLGKILDMYEFKKADELVEQLMVSKNETKRKIKKKAKEKKS